MLSISYVTFYNNSYNSGQTINKNKSTPNGDALQDADVSNGFIVGIGVGNAVSVPPLLPLPSLSPPLLHISYPYVYFVWW